MQLHRRPINGENLKESFEDSLQFTKFCIIFHNFIEYNTLSSLFIELCKSNNIPYFIFSEHCEKFYFNGEYNASDKFKNIVRQLEFNERALVVDVPSYIIFSPICSLSKFNISIPYCVFNRPYRNIFPSARKQHRGSNVNQSAPSLVRCTNKFRIQQVIIFMRKFAF